MANNHNVLDNTFGNNATLIQGGFNATFDIGFPEKESSLLDEISQTNPFYDKKRILDSKGPFLYESFRWILDHEDFNKWRNAVRGGVFWIKGDPGKGKTMLLGGIVDNFEENPERNANLTYFFCQATDSRINTATAILGGLVFSFVKQHLELRSYIRKKYKDELDKLNGPDRWYILCDIFEQITQHPTLPYPICVVDALDECEQETGRKQLLRLIIKTSSRIKWLISSRNITEIERELQAIDSSQRLSLELKENAEYIAKSVDLYINDSIRKIEALQGDDELLIRVTNALKHKVNGTFLWVALVIEQLRDAKHRNVEGVLKEMPVGLENLYNLILQQLIKQEDKDAYQIILSTVTAAERPLCLEELFTFISSQWKDNKNKTTPSLRDIQDMVKDCRSFLSLRNNTVYFIHQSVKDYMMGTACRVIFPTGIEYQHYTMFMTSLNAMTPILQHDIYGLKDPGSDIDTISPPSPDPLAPIAYCCIFWVEHLFRSCESGASRDKIFLKDGRTLHSFLKVKYLCWLESLALLRSLVPQGIDAIQKLKNLFSGHYKSKANRHHGGEMTNFRRERKGSRNRFIHRYKDLYLGTYINYAYKFFLNYDDSRLRTFINNGYQFFHYYKDCVRNYPLQLYHSAIIFEDTQSAIYKTFQQKIRAEFGNSLTFIKMPRTQFSLVQNVELNCRGLIIALLYSPDSSYLCALSEGGTISLCRTDTCTLECVIELKLDKKDNNRFSSHLRHHLLAFSNNSKHLVSISSTGIVQVWAVDCGTQMQKFSLNLNTRLVLCPGRSILQEEVIALSDYGDLAASIYRTLSGAVSLVKVWTIEARKCIYTIDRSHMPDVFHAAFSANSTMMALFNEKVARVYSVQTGKEIKCISSPERFSDSSYEHMIHSRFSRDSKLLVLKYTPWDICTWCTETWKMVRHIGNHSSTSPFDLSPNAAMSVSSSLDALMIQSMDTGDRLLNIKSHGRVYSPIFAPDWTESSILASFSDDAVQIWRVNINTSTKSSDVRNTANYMMHMTISPESKYVAACDAGGNIEIWSGESGKCIRVLQGEASAWSLPVFSPNLQLVFCVQGREGDIQIWHVETGKPLHLLKGPHVQCPDVLIALSDDLAYVAVGYWTGQVKVWCVESGKCLYENDWCDNTTGISEVAFSPCSRYIAAASDGSPATVCVWDWHTGHCISRTELKHKSFVKSLAFSSDATVLVIITDPMSLSCSYKVQFYNLTSGACLGYIQISESNCLPLYDPEKDHVVSDRFRFCKGSSWKHWDAIPRPQYSYFEIGDSIWICFGQHKVFQVPRRLLAKVVQISNTSLVFTNTVGEAFMIQLPDQYII